MLETVYGVLTAPPLAVLRQAVAGELGRAQEGQRAAAKEAEEAGEREREAGEKEERAREALGEAVKEQQALATQLALLHKAKVRGTEAQRASERGTRRGR
eukprot:3691268-Rhodomonas_salina.1